MREAETCTETQHRVEHMAELEAGRLAYYKNEIQKMTEATIKQSSSNADATISLLKMKTRLKELSTQQENTAEIKRREQIVTAFQIELQRDLENFQEPLERELNNLRSQYEGRLAENSELRLVIDCLDDENRVG